VTRMSPDTGLQASPSSPLDGGYSLERRESDSNRTALRLTVAIERKRRGSPPTRNIEVGLLDQRDEEAER
jgi:hypothetical protein